MTITLPVDRAVAWGNHHPKDTARNPIARRLVDPFLAALGEVARRSGARKVHEIGCGEGFLSTMLAQSGLAVRGSRCFDRSSCSSVRPSEPSETSLTRPKQYSANFRANKVCIVNFM